MNHSLVFNLGVVLQSVLEVMLVIELIIICSDVAILLCQSFIYSSLFLYLGVVRIDKSVCIVLVEEVVLLDTLLSFIYSVIKFVLLDQEVGVLMLEEWAELGVVHLLISKSAAVQCISVFFSHLNLIVTSICQELCIFVLNRIHREMVRVEAVHGNELHFLVCVDHVAYMVHWMVKSLKLVIWRSQLSQISVVSKLLAAHAVSHKRSVLHLHVLTVDFVCLHKHVVLGEEFLKLSQFVKVLSRAKFAGKHNMVSNVSVFWLFDLISCDLSCLVCDLVVGAQLVDVLVSLEEDDVVLVVQD